MDIGETGVWVLDTGALEVLAVSLGSSATSPCSGAASPGAGVLAGLDAIPGGGVEVKTDRNGTGVVWNRTEAIGDY